MFDIRCGVGPGDPLSSLLFILAVEVLACRIRDDKGIKDILINGEEIKLKLFADDMTCFLRDIASYHRLLATLQIFYKFSNLRVNDDKTEIFAIGSHHLDPATFSHQRYIEQVEVDRAYTTRKNSDCSILYSTEICE